MPTNQMVGNNSTVWVEIHRHILRSCSFIENSATNMPRVAFVSLTWSQVGCNGWLYVEERNVRFWKL